MEYQLKAKRAGLIGLIISFILVGTSSCSYSGGKPSHPLVPLTATFLPPLTQSVPNVSTTLPAEITGSATASSEQPQPGIQIDSLSIFDPNEGWLWGATQTNEYLLFHTQDGGQTWQNVTPNGVVFSPEASHFYDARTAWLGITPDPIKIGDQISIVRTSDGGQNWQQISFHWDQPEGDMVLGEMQFCDPNQGFAIFSTAAAGNIFLQIYSSRDGGRTWDHFLPNPIGNEPGLTAGTLHIEDGDSILFRCNGEIWITSGFGFQYTYASMNISRDSGKTWQVIKLPLPEMKELGTANVYALKPVFFSTVIYLPVLVGTKLVVFASQNGGLNWTVRSGSALELGEGANPLTLHLDFVTPLDGFVACGEAFCVTQDGAQTWKTITPNIPPGQLNGVANNLLVNYEFVTPQVGFAIINQTANGPSLIYKTLDGGNSWFRLNDPITNR